MKHIRLYLVLAAVLFSAGTMRAQLGGRYVDGPTATSIVIGVKAGIVVSSARGTFPSLLMEGTKKGSGDIAEQYALSGSGNRVSMAFLIPFSPQIGLSVDIGSLVYSAKYTSPTMSTATQFKGQTIQLGIGAEGSVFNDAQSYATGTGLRSVYVNGGFDFGIVTVANSVTAALYPDTTAAAAAQPASGHFENNDAFRSLVSLRAGVGMRFAVASHWELQVEADYSYALNKVFSSDAIRNNDFTVDNFYVLGGLGYRF